MIAEPDSTSRALERCVGDAGRFAREYWARAPLYRPAADGDAFADLFGLADVDHLVTSAGLRTPAFRLVRDGTPLPPDSYTKSGRIGSRPLSDLADPGRIVEHFRGGATIVLQSLHRYWPPLTRFCRDLEVTLTHPVQVNVYVTPPASRGLGVHHDTHDVFVLQVHGSKQWDVYEVGTTDVRIAAELQPGDAMYIPRTFPHQARTAEAASVHLTVGILTTTWRDVLGRCVEDALADAAYGEPLPIGFASDPAALVPSLAEGLRELAGRLEKIDPAQIAEDAATRFVAGRAPNLAGQLQQVLGLDAIDDGTLLRRRPGALSRLRREGETLVLVLGDRSVRLPAWTEPAVRAVLDRPSLTVGDLGSHLDEHSRLVLARRLVREGLLVVG